MDRKVDVVVIGAGSAGLSALRQIKQKTSNYLIVDHGPLGTKCARLGCMPSKALISIAKDYHRIKRLQKKAIISPMQSQVNIPAVLEEIRNKRDYFADNMVKSTKKLAGDKLIHKHAKITGIGRVEIGGDIVETRDIIIAAGSSPKIPDKWRQFGDKILTSDNIFEQTDLPRNIVVVGLGAIGLEIGQSLSRLGVNVIGFDMKESIANLTDVAINKKAVEILSQEFPIYLGSKLKVKQRGDRLLVSQNEMETEADAIFAAMGVSPNIEGLGLENLGVELNEKGLPEFNSYSCQVDGMSVFIAGDVNGCRPILHEALDEGYVAGSNVKTKEVDCYCRRVSMSIVFSDPQIVSVGQNIKQLEEDEVDFVVGEVDFSDQSRARLEGRNKGLLRIYADKSNGLVLGAEMVLPDAEHLGHQLGQAISGELTVFDMLMCPFYHPTIEEGLRSCLMDAANQLSDGLGKNKLEICSSCPESPLC